MGIFDFIFKKQNAKKEALINKLKENHLIIDVRSPQEFSLGHIKGALNIPLQNIGSESKRLKTMGKTIITCCRSGARSKSAASVLQSKNINAINGGGWTNLNNIINSL